MRMFFPSSLLVLALECTFPDQNTSIVWVHTLPTLRLSRVIISFLEEQNGTLVQKKLPSDVEHTVQFLVITDHPSLHQPFPYITSVKNLGLILGQVSWLRLLD